jgi:D-alanyl-lipoteichoic acid acyltransferase DltB (MBOAT superfamily)
LPIVFALYWIFANKHIRVRNIYITAVSYFFYGWWDWRFLSLLFISTLVDYSVGMGFLNTRNITKRKILLWISISVNLGILCLFKYFNFFLENFKTAFSFLGAEIEANSLRFILPVGISFYTFQTLSYTIDIYRGKIEPTRDFFAFSAFVSFFPQLVAGPIERATKLLPQFYRRSEFQYAPAVDGLRQILWGLFKKVVIADNCAKFANMTFNHSGDYSGSTLLAGAMFFAFQIYCDFSGYSDIAIGTSKLFGFSLMRNFAFPYFSRDIAEFWRRWHISLTTWFRDYLYIPLGGSRGTTIEKIRNIFVVFIVSGFWHGANWTFIIWGALNAALFLPLLLLGKNRNRLDIAAKGRIFPSAGEFLEIGATFFLTVLAWIFFRAATVEHAFRYLSIICSKSLFTIPNFGHYKEAWITTFFVLIFFSVEWFGREHQYALAQIVRFPKPVRRLVYYVLIGAIFCFAGSKQEFIYFQF